MSEAVGPYGLPAAHEARCRRCGLSCHLAVPVNGLPVAVPGLACRFLRPDGPQRFTCTVYDRRFETAPWCRTVDQAVAEGLLGQDCPYVIGRGGYRGKVWLHRRLLARVLPAIRAHILDVGVPESVDPAAAAVLLSTPDAPLEPVFDAATGRYRFRAD